MSSSLDANRSKPIFDKECLCLRSQISATKSLSCALPSKSASWGLFLDAVIASNVPDALSVSISKRLADSCSHRPLTPFVILIWPCKNGRNGIFHKISPCTCQTLFVVRLDKVLQTTIEGSVGRDFFCRHVPMFPLEFEPSEKREKLVLSGYQSDYCKMLQRNTCGSNACYLIPPYFPP